MFPSQLTGTWWMARAEWSSNIRLSKSSRRSGAAVQGTRAASRCPRTRCSQTTFPGGEMAGRYLRAIYRGSDKQCKVLPFLSDL